MDVNKLMDYVYEYKECKDALDLRLECQHAFKYIERTKLNVYLVKLEIKAIKKMKHRLVEKYNCIS